MNATIMPDAFTVAGVISLSGIASRRVESARTGLGEECCSGLRFGVARERLEIDALSRWIV